MTAPSARSVGCPEGPPPRTNGTPSGYRNIRVLAANSLHFRLVAYAGLSMCSLNEFILKLLNLATPIDPTTGRPVPAGTLEMAHGHRPVHDQQGGPGAVPGRGATRTAKEPAPCHRPAIDQPARPGPAVGPGAAPSPGALVGSRLDQAVDPTPSGSLPTLDQAPSLAGQDHDPAEAERTPPR